MPFIASFYYRERILHHHLVDLSLRIAKKCDQIKVRIMASFCSLQHVMSFDKSLLHELENDLIFQSIFTRKISF